MSELAATYVRIRPRSTGFKSEADAQLQREKPGDVAVSVTADTRPANDRLALLGDRLDTLRLKTATTTVDINDTRATAKLASIDAAMDRLDRARANPKIDVEGVAKAEAQVEALNLQLDRLGERRVAAGGSGAGGILGRLGSSGAFGALPVGITGLAAASVPVGIAGLGAGASFLTPTVAGGLGLGLFGATTKSALTRVDKVQTQIEAINKRIALTPATRPAGSAAQQSAAQQSLIAAQTRLDQVRAATTFNPAAVASAQAGVTSAQQRVTTLQGGGANPAYTHLVQQRTQLLNQLTPAEKQAAAAIGELEHRWKSFQRALEPQSFKLLATGADIFTKGLRLALPMTKAVGDEVDHLAKRADKALSDPFWHHFFGEFLTKEAPRAVDTLFVSIGNVVTGLAHLSEGFAPLGHGLETDLVNITARFNAWTQGDGPGAFVALVRRDGPVVAQAIEGIAHGLIGVGKGLEPIGRIELQALTPVLDFIGELGKQHPEVITALGAAYLSVALGLKGIAAVKGIAGAAGAVSALGAAKSGGKGVLGGILGSTVERGASPANPIYVVVVNGGSGLPGGGKEPVPVGKPSRFSTLKKIIPAPLVLAEAYFATQGGDQNPAQTPLGASTIRNGPAITSLIAGVGPRIPLNQGQDFFTGALDQPGGRPVNPTALVNNTLTFGTPQQIARLHELAKTIPGISAGLKAWNQQQDVLNKLLVVNPGLTKNAAAGNKILGATLQGLATTAKGAGHDIGTDLGIGLIQGIEAQIPHATVAGQLLVASTVKQMRLSAQADQRSAVSVVPKPEKVKKQATDAGTAVGSAYGGGVASGVTAAAPLVSAAVTNLVARIQARLQAASATEQQLASSLLGQTGFAGFSAQTNALGLPVAPTTAGLLQGLRHQRVALGLFRQRLHRESEHGLSTGAEQQIIGLGLGQGGAYAASLSHASRAQLRSISNLLGDVHGEALNVSKDVTRDIYGPKIVDLLGQLAKLNHNNPEVAKELRRLNNQLDALGLEIRGAQHKAASRTSH